MKRFFADDYLEGGVFSSILYWSTKTAMENSHIRTFTILMKVLMHQENGKNT